MDWTARFRQQAAWTRPLREHLFQRYHLSRARRVLDLGCGTGALWDDLLDRPNLTLMGVDISLHYLRQTPAQRNALPVCGDAHTLPFPDSSFDLSLCHFVLMWVRSPSDVLQEMRRVTRPGGAVLALAEPDYGGRIDYPPSLVQPARWQIASLCAQGADPFIGRRLRALFHQAGLEQIEVGVLGAQWGEHAFDDDLEWEVLEEDLKQTPDFKTRLAAWKQQEQRARRAGERVLFVPTFYAAGVVR